LIQAVVIDPGSGGVFEMPVLMKVMRGGIALLTHFAQNRDLRAATRLRVFRAVVATALCRRGAEMKTP